MCQFVRLVSFPIVDSLASNMLSDYSALFGIIIIIITIVIPTAWKNCYRVSAVERRTTYRTTNVDVKMFIKFGDFA